MYQRFSGGEGRQHDSRHESTDGQYRMYTKLDRNDYCINCRQKSDSPYGSVKAVVDCRSQYDEDLEDRSHINTD